MLFSSKYLAETLKKLPEAQRYWIGFSGGQDSLVLLHALVQAQSQAQLKPELIALHINHSINAEADHWQQQCQQIAEAYAIGFRSIKVDGNHPPGESPEAWARQQRYRAFSSVMEAGDMLLLAQHQADQAETLLIQLLRGSGPHGLAAMPFLSEFSTGWIARPLLEMSKVSIEDYAQDQQLSWIEDPSNQDQNYDRNYLRHQVLPLLEDRWPAYARSLNRSASLQAEAASLIDCVASQDFNTLTINQADVSRLLISELIELDDIRLRNLLRYWIRKSGYPVPSASKLNVVINELLAARPDRMPCVGWAGVEVRRHGDEIRLMPSLPEHDSNAIYRWDLSKPLKLDIGTLVATQVSGSGLAISKLGSHGDLSEVSVRFRNRGEKFTKPGNQHRTGLKKYFQEQRIPVWLRDRIPLIYFKEELVAVSDLSVADEYRAKGEDEGWEISWLPSE